MLNTKEHFNQLDAIAVTEFDNETAAAIQGGQGGDASYALEVFKHSKETIPNESLGSFNFGKSALSPTADNQISSVNVRAGKWIFSDFPGGGGLSTWLVTKTGWQNVPWWINDKISFIRRL